MGNTAGEATGPEDARVMLRAELATAGATAENGETGPEGNNASGLLEGNAKQEAGLAEGAPIHGTAQQGRENASGVERNSGDDDNGHANALRRLDHSSEGWLGAGEALNSEDNANAAAAAAAGDDDNDAPASEDEGDGVACLCAGVKCMLDVLSQRNADENAAEESDDAKAETARAYLIAAQVLKLKIEHITGLPGLSRSRALSAVVAACHRHASASTGAALVAYLCTCDVITPADVLHLSRRLPRRTADWLLANAATAPASPASLAVHRSIAAVRRARTQRLGTRGLMAERRAEVAAALHLARSISEGLSTVASLSDLPLPEVESGSNIITATTDADALSSDEKEQLIRDHGGAATATASTPLSRLRCRQLCAWLLAALRTRCTRAPGEERQSDTVTAGGGGPQSLLPTCTLTAVQVEAACDVLTQLGFPNACLDLALWVVSETAWDAPSLLPALVSCAWAPNATLLRCMPSMLVQLYEGLVPVLEQRALSPLSITATTFLSWIRAHASDILGDAPPLVPPPLEEAPLPRTSGSSRHARPRPPAIAALIASPTSADLASARAEAAASPVAEAQLVDAALTALSSSSKDEAQQRGEGYAEQLAAAVIDCLQASTTARGLVLKALEPKLKSPQCDAASMAAFVRQCIALRFLPPAPIVKVLLQAATPTGRGSSAPSPTVQAVVGHFVAGCGGAAEAEAMLLPCMQATKDRLGLFHLLVIALSGSRTASPLAAAHEALVWQLCLRVLRCVAEHPRLTTPQLLSSSTVPALRAVLAAYVLGDAGAKTAWKQASTLLQTTSAQELIRAACRTCCPHTLSCTLHLIKVVLKECTAVGETLHEEMMRALMEGDEAGVSVECAAALASMLPGQTRDRLFQLIVSAFDDDALLLRYRGFPLLLRHAIHTRSQLCATTTSVAAPALSLWVSRVFSASDDELPPLPLVLGAVSCTAVLGVAASDAPSDTLSKSLMDLLLKLIQIFVLFVRIGAGDLAPSGDWHPTATTAFLPLIRQVMCIVADACTRAVPVEGRDMQDLAKHAIRLCERISVKDRKFVYALLPAISLVPVQYYDPSGVGIDTLNEDVLPTSGCSNAVICQELDEDNLRDPVNLRIPKSLLIPQRRDNNPLSWEKLGAKLVSPPAALVPASSEHDVFHAVSKDEPKQHQQNQHHHSSSHHQGHQQHQRTRHRPKRKAASSDAHTQAAEASKMAKRSTGSPP